MASYHLRVKDDTKSSGKKVSAKRHAEYILREDGKSHANYINREGAQSNRDDCVFKGSQLPKWAKGSAQKFFSVATRYEDKGNVRYREIELSLPNELTLEQNWEIVDKFIKNHLANNYYAYAIHEKAGEMSSERHPHVHIMFSERLIDDVERINERPAYRYFRRAAKPLKGEKVASFERRREHGAPKDKKWHNRKYLYKIREDFARIQNEVLAQNGFSIRVDHRTLKAQQLEAEKNGDEFLAQVFKRTPESYIGIIATHGENTLATDVKNYRTRIQQKQSQLFQIDMNKKTTEEGKTNFLVKQAELASRALIDSTAYKEMNLDDESLRVLNQCILSGLGRIRELKRKLVGSLCAKVRAQKEYLTAAEYQFILDYESKLRQSDHWERLRKKLALSNWEYPNYLVQRNQKYWAIQEKMQNPYRRKNIELVIHSLLQNDLKILTELKKTSEDVLRNVAVMRDKIEAREIPKTVFSAKEVRDHLQEQYLFLKSQHEEATEKRNSLRFKIISLAQALLRAKNIFVHGGFEKLHAKQETYEKTSAQFELANAQYRQRQLFFNSRQWTQNSEKLQEQYYLTKKKIHLEATAKKLSETKTQLYNELSCLETLCQTKTAREKIALLTAGILHKSLKTAQEYEAAKKLVKDLSEKLKVAKKRFESFKENFSRLKKNRVYRVIVSERDSLNTSSLNENELTAIIADALFGEKYAVPLVARSSGNNLEMEKSWELMSELDKDEFLQRKIIREL